MSIIAHVHRCAIMLIRELCKKLYRKITKFAATGYLEHKLIVRLSFPLIPCSSRVKDVISCIHVIFPYFFKFIHVYLYLFKRIHHTVIHFNTLAQNRLLNNKVHRISLTPSTWNGSNRHTIVVAFYGQTRPSAKHFLGALIRFPSRQSP